MLTSDQYRELGLALREARTAGNRDDVERLEDQLATAPAVLRRIYLGELPPRRPIVHKPIRAAFLEELLERTTPAAPMVPGRSRGWMFAACGLLVAAVLVAFIAPRSKPGPLPSLPARVAIDDGLRTVKPAVDQAAAALLEVQQITETVRAQTAALSAMTANHAQAREEATLAGVAALRTELEATQAQLEANVASVDGAVREASRLARAHSSRDVQQLLADAVAAVETARSAATSVRANATAALSVASKALASRKRSPPRTNAPPQARVRPPIIEPIDAYAPPR